MAKLLVQESAGVREFELVDLEVRIGRELDNTLRLADPSISRHHALLRRKDTGYEVEDLGSSNGVLVNGAKVQSSPLQDGDRITLGQVQLTFADPKPVAASAPAPVEPPSPLGTVRISPEEMAKMHNPLAEVPGAKVEVPEESRSTVKAPAKAPDAPAFGQFTNPGNQPLAENPAPAFLRPWLPPVPDDAVPLSEGDAPERGDFVTRLIAYLIDIAPVVAIVVIFIVIGFVLAMVPVLACIAGCVLWLIETLLLLGYSFFFLPWCWSKFGATPGKKMMKLRVVPEGDPTGRIDLGTAYLRLLGHIVNGFLFGLPYLIILGAERKGIQDYISKSIVIKVDR